VLVAWYVPATMSVPTAHVPSPMLVASGPDVEAGDQVPQPSDSNAASDGAMVTITGPKGSASAMTSLAVPPRLLNRAHEQSVPPAAR